VRGRCIVRVPSASARDTWRVTRTRKPTTHERRDPAEPGAAPQPELARTPVPRAELLTCAGELRGLMEELSELTGCGSAWTVRVLRRNVELALLSPESLDSAENQLDFIEELAEAVWDPADVGFRYAVRPAATADGTQRRDQRRRAVVERLDEIANRLCAEAEGWQDRTAAAAEGRSPETRFPQDDHRS